MAWSVRRNAPCRPVERINMKTNGNRTVRIYRTARRRKRRSKSARAKGGRCCWACWGGRRLGGSSFPRRGLKVSASYWTSLREQSKQSSGWAACRKSRTTIAPRYATPGFNYRSPKPFGTALLRCIGNSNSERSNRGRSEGVREVKRRKIWLNLATSPKPNGRRDSIRFHYFYRRTSSQFHAL